MSLTFKTLTRKRGTAHSILAIALLVAIYASAKATVNYLNFQAEFLGSLVNPGATYIILSRNATSVTESRIDTQLSKHLTEVAEIEQVFPQKISTANMKTEYSNIAVNVRALENVENFLKYRGARINGTFAEDWFEVNVGEVLARIANIALNAPLTLSNNGKTVNLTVAGVFRSQTELDSEILIPINAGCSLFAADDKRSFIEFTLKEGKNSVEALTRLAERLPPTVQVVKVQQPAAFIQEANMQTTAYLDVWSLAVYAVVALASYIVTARLTAESAYELAMLKALGATKRRIFTLCTGYTVLTAFLGAVLGTALGVAAAQTASTLLRWLQPTVEIAPLLQAEQVLKAIVLTLASAVLGSAVAAYRSARLGYVEQPL